MTLRPDLGAEKARRPIAKESAERWRTNDGRYCSATSLEKLTEMIETGMVKPDFPSLSYRSEQPPPVAQATPEITGIDVCAVGPSPSRVATVKDLQKILRAYDLPVGGTKDALLVRLAELAADHYRKHLPQMRKYFTRHRFIRMSELPKQTIPFPILEKVQHPRNLLLAMYILKHLRGDVLLEVSHQNDTYSVEELAAALVTGKLTLTGAFLRVE